jgi:hypothetical protein
MNAVPLQKRLRKKQARRETDWHSVLLAMTTIQGTLQIVANMSFLQPSGVQLVMRNTPPGGIFTQRAAAATAILTQSVGASNGSLISVTGDPDPHDVTVFLMDSAA